jgi:hypothetical protein
MILKDFVNKFKLTQPKVTSIEEIIEVETLPSAAIIDIKDLHIKALEYQIELLNEKLSQVVPITNKSSSIRIRKHSKIVDVIIAVFSNAEKDLNANEVLERMDKKKLKNKNPDILSVRAALYYLKDIGVLRFGVAKGTFAVRGQTI